jgi:hypothetical protein
VRANGANNPHIMTDQQQWATIAGRRVAGLRTSTGWHDEGLLFERSYTPSAVCCPARAMLLSGAYHWHNGVYNQVHSPPSRHRDMKSRCSALIAAPARRGLSPGLMSANGTPRMCARRSISVSTKLRASRAATPRFCKSWI